jgi:hypothetical protein
LSPDFPDSLDGDEEETVEVSERVSANADKLPNRRQTITVQSIDSSTDRRTELDSAADRIIERRSRKWLHETSPESTSCSQSSAGVERSSIQDQPAAAAGKSCHEKRTKTDHLSATEVHSRKGAAFRRNRIVSSDSDSGETDVESQGADVARKSTSVNRSRCLVSRKKWSDEELQILETEFARFVTSDASPRWSDIEQVKKKFPCFESRTKEMIKARFIHLKRTGR